MSSRFAIHVLLCAVVALWATACSRRPRSTQPATTETPADHAAAGGSESLFDGTCARDEPACKREVAILAGGCFWGMEDILRNVPGVIDTEVGYTGGSVAAPTYDHVRTGESGHAEAVRIVFDPSKLSYEELLEKWFFRMHDPTTKDRQGNDVGTQYRSAIFVFSDRQREVAKTVLRRVDASGKWKAPIVTEVVSAGPFTRAEAYHQDYLVKNPGGYTCHYLRD